MIPKRLIYARKSKNLTQRRLAELLGIEGNNPNSTFSTYETGRAQPSYATMIKISKILDFPVGYFYIEEDYLAEAIVQIYRDRLDPAKNPYHGAISEIEELREELREKDDILARISDLIGSLKKF